LQEVQTEPDLGPSPPRVERRGKREPQGKEKSKRGGRKKREKKEEQGLGQRGRGGGKVLRFRCIIHVTGSANQEHTQEKRALWRKYNDGGKRMPRKGENAIRGGFRTA